MATDDQLKGITAKLEVKLGALTVRLVGEADAMDVGELGAAAVFNALDQVPGARSVAADIVSKGMYEGLGATFDEHADQVDEGDGGGGGWDYSAVNDGATCDECAAQDGDHYATWDEIAGPGGPLPDGGPNPDCYGTDRCRCRAVIA